MESDLACSTGWLSHWGEPMANTSLDQFIDTLHGTLGFANNTGSVNLYMAHGGTNFGFTAGALLAAHSLNIANAKLDLDRLHYQGGRQNLLAVGRTFCQLA
jgi:hypothetical protein